MIAFLPLAAVVIYAAAWSLRHRAVLARPGLARTRTGGGPGYVRAGRMPSSGRRRGDLAVTGSALSVHSGYPVGAGPYSWGDDPELCVLLWRAELAAQPETETVCG